MRFLVVLFCFQLSACGLFSTKTRNESPWLVTGEEMPENADYEQIHKALMKDATISFGDMRATVIPLTKPYLLARAWKWGSSAALSLEQIRLNAQQDLKNFSENRTCFEVLITSRSGEDSVRLENWPVAAIDHRKMSHELSWRPSDLKQNPSTEWIPMYHGDGKKWHAQGVACSQTPLELDKGFQIVFSPKQTHLLSASELALNYRFDQITINKEGEKVMTKQTPKKTQPWRSW